MILTLGDERLLALVLADVLLLLLVVPLGASALLLVGVPTLVLVAVVTPGFKKKTECISICMPGSSFIHIETS